MEMHPAEESTLLIAYEDRGIVYWDLKKSKVKLALSITAPVHCVSWCPNGTSFVAGLRDGNV
jgi:WD40 repeat protein